MFACAIISKNVLGLNVSPSILLGNKFTRSFFFFSYYFGLFKVSEWRQSLPYLACQTITYLKYFRVIHDQSQLASGCDVSLHTDYVDSLPVALHAVCYTAAGAHYLCMWLELSSDMLSLFLFLVIFSSS